MFLGSYVTLLGELGKSSGALADRAQHIPTSQSTLGRLWQFQDARRCCIEAGIFTLISNSRYTGTSVTSSRSRFCGWALQVLFGRSAPDHTELRRCHCGNSARLAPILSRTDHLCLYTAPILPRRNCKTATRADDLTRNAVRGPGATNRKPLLCRIGSHTTVSVYLPRSGRASAPTPEREPRLRAPFSDY
jgi:hypothetical protein